MIVKDLFDKVIARWKQGDAQVFNPGFKNFSNFYNVLQGSCTDWTGYPTSGKTELLLEVLMNCSNFYGHKHLLYMPDAGTEVEVIGDLLTKYSGKPFGEYYFWQGEKHKNYDRITEKEIAQYLPEIQNSFMIYSQDSKTLTPIQFWEYACDYAKNNTLHSAVIDSWNYMHHDIGSLRQDQWLEATLSKRNQLAEKSKLHFHTVIHPKSATYNKNGLVVVPTAHSLKGGSEWYNNGKSIICVDRPNSSGNIADVYIQKAKPRIVGVKGDFSLNFDVKKSRYYYDTGLEKIYAKHPSEQIEPIEEPTF